MCYVCPFLHLQCFGVTVSMVLIAWMLNCWWWLNTSIWISIKRWRSPFLTFPWLDWRSYSHRKNWTRHNRRRLHSCDGRTRRHLSPLCSISIYRHNRNWLLFFLNYLARYDKTSWSSNPPTTLHGPEWQRLLMRCMSADICNVTMARPCWHNGTLHSSVLVGPYTLNFWPSDHQSMDVIIMLLSVIDEIYTWILYGVENKYNSRQRTLKYFRRQDQELMVMIFL